MPHIPGHKDTEQLLRELGSPDVPTPSRTQELISGLSEPPIPTINRTETLIQGLAEEPAPVNRTRELISGLDSPAPVPQPPTDSPGPFQFRGVRQFFGGIGEAIGQAGLQLGSLGFDFSGTAGNVDDPTSAPSRVFRERQRIADERRPPESGTELTGRLIGAILTGASSEVPLSSGDLLNDPLTTSVIAVPGGTAIGAPAAKAVGPLTHAAFLDAKNFLTPLFSRTGVQQAPLRPVATQLATRPTVEQAQSAIRSIRKVTRPIEGTNQAVEFTPPRITPLIPDEITIQGRNFTKQELIDAGGGTRIQTRGLGSTEAGTIQRSIAASEAEFSRDIIGFRNTLARDAPDFVIVDDLRADFILEVTNLSEDSLRDIPRVLNALGQASEAAARRSRNAALRADEEIAEATANAIERGLAKIGRETPTLTGRPTEGSAQFPPPIRPDTTPPPIARPITKPPRTLREVAVQKVDLRLAAQERIQQSPLLKRVTEAIKGTKIVQRASAEMISEQRPGRFAAGMRASEGGDVLTRGRRFFGAQRGEFETLEPDDAIKGLFTDNEFRELVGMIRDPDLFPVSRGFQMNTADRAFQKLFSENLLPTEGEIALLETVFGKNFVRTTMSKRSLGTKAWSNFLALWNLPRALVASGDLSGTLRQAGILATGNPRRFAQANVAQIKAVRSQRNFLIEKELIEGNPNFQRFTQKAPRRPGEPARTRLQMTSTSGSAPLNQREEAFLSAWAEKIPVVRQSQRAFVTLLNKLRMDVMDDMIGVIEVGGRKATERQLDAAANFVNSATGRGPLPVPQAVASLFNGLFFSTRLFTSRLALPFHLITKSPTIRKKIATDLVKTVAAVMTMEAMVKFSGIGEVETDARSSDVGKMKFGKTRIDPWFGYQQIVRLVWQLATSERKSVGTGAVSQLERDAFGLVNQNIVYRFLRSKLNPSAGDVITLESGEDFTGEDIGLGSFIEPFRGTGVQTPSDLLDVRKNPIAQNTVFLFIQDMLDAIAEEGVMSGFKAAIPAFLGTGVTTFTTPDDISREVNGRPFTEIYPFQQTEARVIFYAQEDNTPEHLPDGKINPDIPRNRQLDISRMDKLREVAVLAQRAIRRDDIRNVINQYFGIKAENAIRKDEARENIFGDTDYQQDARGTAAEKVALQEYFDAQERSKSPAGRFLNDEWQQRLRLLTQKWQAEGTLLYVQANTNTKPIPEELEAFLRRHSRKEWQRIQASKRAREVLSSRQAP